MIKFFRRIRQNLVLEGKSGKYLKYAVGEIVLVVIGILIALQINNWNEHRKVLKAQEDLLESFYDNLEADSVELAKNKKVMLEIIQTQKQLHAFHEGKIQSDSVNNPIKIRGSIRISSIAQTNHPDIAAQVLNESIKEEISEYYRLLSGMEDAYKQYHNIVLERIRPYLREKIALNADFLFENQAQLVTEQAEALNLENFYEAVKNEYFSQLLFESYLKAMELIEYFDRVFSANYKLRLTITNEFNGLDK